MAVQTTQGMPLAQALIGELRRRRIELPPMATLERVCASAATRAQRQIHQLLVAPLSPQQRDAIDKVLDLREGSSSSTLAWLRQSPGKPSAKSVLAHIERLTAIREIGLPPDIGRDVPLLGLLQAAGTRMSQGLPFPTLIGNDEQTYVRIVLDPQAILSLDKRSLSRPRTA